MVGVPGAAWGVGWGLFPPTFLVWLSGSPHFFVLAGGCWARCSGWLSAFLFVSFRVFIS